MDKQGNAIPQTLQQHLQQLGQQFAERLRQELPQLMQQGEQLLEASDEQRGQLLRALRDQLHRLAGSAGTFGFDLLGQQARELEQQAERWLEQQQRQQQDLDIFVAALLQLGEQSDADSSQDEQQKTAKPLARTENDTRLIYILEDEMTVGENMRLTLSNFGYRAEHFQTTTDLDTALLQQLPDALIVDVNLANEDSSGLDYAARLQQRLEVPLPLLVLTHQHDFATQLQAVRAGAQGFFAKPVDIPQLESRLERCFAQQSGEPYRVLIVDDDRDLASRYSLVLRDAGMLVEILQDPAQIFEHLRDFNPEVVLLDVNMPDCTGPELAQIIRCNDDWLRIPIIYLSAETDIAKQMNALIKAGDDFVTKPISDNALVAAVFSRAQRARLLSDALSRDSLTGLLKHGDIKEQVATELERALRTGNRASVVIAGHRSLQTGQRRAWPRGRRQCHPRAGQPAAPAPAPDRQPGALWRRGVSRGAAGLHTAAGQTDRRRDPRTLRRAALHRRRRRIFLHPQRRYSRHRRTQPGRTIARARRQGALCSQAWWPQPGAGGCFGRASRLKLHAP